MKGQLTRDEDGDLWMYIAPHHTGYWKFVDADDNWVDRGMALQVTGDAAVLFAAAPELLAACHKLVDSDLAVEGDERKHQLKLARLLAADAIAKAEGVVP
jgi:hypothetical protein